jgi:hypothetical protein
MFAVQRVLDQAEALLHGNQATTQQPATFERNPGTSRSKSGAKMMQNRVQNRVQHWVQSRVQH